MPRSDRTPPTPSPPPQEKDDFYGTIALNRVLAAVARGVPFGDVGPAAVRECVCVCGGGRGVLFMCAHMRVCGVLAVGSV